MSFIRRAASRVLRRGAPGRASSPAITDQQLSATLGVYAGMVDRVLDQPERWLGVAPDDGTGRLPARLLRRARRTVAGDVPPGSAGWDRLPVERRVRWWTTRISLTAGAAAATPRLAGLLADRVPLQAALGASASGLAVCATARESGVEDPEDWVPLLGEVIFGRHLSPGEAVVPDVAESEAALSAAADDDSEPPSAMAKLGEDGRRAVRGMWRLARALLELQGIFDDRPHGGLVARLLARLPVVGVVGGWLDERGAIATAAEETTRLLAQGTL